MSGGGAAASLKCGQLVVVLGRIGLGGDAERGLGGRTYRGGGRYGWDGDGYGLNWWEDTAANAILGTGPNSPLASAPGLELHHMIMSIIGGQGGRLDRYRDREQ